MCNIFLLPVKSLRETETIERYVNGIRLSIEFNDNPAILLSYKTVETTKYIQTLSSPGSLTLLLVDLVPVQLALVPALLARLNSYLTSQAYRLVHCRQSRFRRSSVSNSMKA